MFFILGQSYIEQTMAHNVEMPHFATAGGDGIGKMSDWGDVDHFDVEMLAEYLLGDDGNVSGAGMTFDFK